VGFVYERNINFWNL